ncbi:hypothetical protein OSTOST_10928 [Ostertagia ostertagi]
MAGNASCSWAMHNDMVEESRKFAERNGIHETRDSKKMVDALRGLPCSKFALSLMENMEKPSVASSCASGPRLDFDFIPKSVSELRKEAPAKPMLIGCSASEGLMFLGFGKHHSVSAIMNYVSQLVPEKEYPRTFKKLREEVFEKLVSNPAITLEVTRALAEVCSLSLAFAIVAYATHCTELAYIFAVGIIWNYEFNHDDKKMLELTTRMWTNFAKYG